MKVNAEIACLGATSFPADITVPLTNGIARKRPSQCVLAVLCEYPTRRPYRRSGGPAVAGLAVIAANKRTLASWPTATLEAPR